jgi:N-acetylglucosamine-6-phosphate deacetylase
LRVLKGNLVTPFQTIEHGQIEVEGSKITYVGHRRDCRGDVLDYGEAVIAPGFIDIHVHGLAGYDIMDPGINSIQQISKHLAAKGVTGFLATLQTAPLEEIVEALKRVKQAMETGVSGAKVLGSHLEGPYINVIRMGAQQEYTREPNERELKTFLEAARGALKVVTLAPEVHGGLEAVRYLKENNVLVSAGHTDASYCEACQAFKAGVSLLGHLWNGMRGVHHREPGIVGAGLMDEDIAVELIADCLHVHPAILGLTVKLKGAKNIALVSDSIKPAGLPSGEYSFDGRTFLVEDGLVKLLSGVIAGSAMGLNDAVKNMVEKVGVNLPQAVQMASDTPARVLGLMKGKLEPGYDADIVIMDEGLRVVETIVEGSSVYKTGEGL